MSTIITPNMNLPVPGVGTEAGPQYAQDVNNCFTTIDSHNHASGSGVQITPNGLNINSDLPINLNNLILVRTVRFSSQASAIPGASPDLNCLYVSGVDLYYNDGNGNQIPITNAGGVAGSPGSISNLVAPASANYVAGNSTFVWQSAAATSANMDFGSAIFRKLTASSNGITVSAPSSLSTDYTLTLPALPSVQSFMTLDASGNISAPWTVDNSTLQISGSNVIVKDLGITTAKIADGAVTLIKTAAIGQQISGSSGMFGSTSITPVDITNMSVTLTTIGRPVLISVQPITGTSSNGSIGGASSGPDSQSRFYLLRDGTVIVSYFVYGQSGAGPTSNYLAGGMTFLDVNASAGSHTYKLQADASGGGPYTVVVTNMTLVAWEL